MRIETARQAVFGLLVAIATLFALPRAAHAAGSFKFSKNEATEVSGAWRMYITIQLPKAPIIAHQPMRFLFTKTMVYERALVDGQSEPVVHRQALQNQAPSVESMDVNFSDASGKIHKGTRFDFSLTRVRGYEAGEYTVEIRTSDGVKIGSPTRIVLKGDNEVVDRRSIAFNASDKGVKKVDTYAANAPPKDDDPAPAAHMEASEVAPVGVATGFVPPEGFEETDEELMRTRPKGCGCDVPGHTVPGGLLSLAVPALGIGVIALRRRAARRAA